MSMISAISTVISAVCNTITVTANATTKLAHAGDQLAGKAAIEARNWADESIKANADPAAARKWLDSL